MSSKITRITPVVVLTATAAALAVQHGCSAGIAGGGGEAGDRRAAASGGPLQITGSGQLEVAFDRNVKAAGLYGVSQGRAWGVWPDGPLHPWRDHLGRTYFNVPHSENHRVRVPSWSSPAGWTVEPGAVFDSRKTYPAKSPGEYFHLGNHCNTGDLSEPDYDNRIWLFGFWSTGSKVYALAHHEWYAACKAGALVGSPPRKWVNALHHAVSSDGGATFLPRPYRPYAASGTSNSERLVLVPEPYGVQQTNAHYGFFHPTNIVKEGAHYYAYVHHVVSTKGGGDQLTMGAAAVRTTDVTRPGGWQLLTPGGWQPVNRGTYQGNGGQRARLFFAGSCNPYVACHWPAMKAMSLHRHAGSGRWLLFGWDGSRDAIVFHESASLADPRWEQNGAAEVANTRGKFSWPPYVSVVDHHATDRNFQAIGDTIHIYDQQDYRYYVRMRATIAGGGAPGPGGGAPGPGPGPGCAPLQGTACTVARPTSFPDARTGKPFCWPDFSFHGAGHAGCSCAHTAACPAGTSVCQCAGPRGRINCAGKCALPALPATFDGACWPAFAFALPGWKGCSCAASAACPGGTAACSCAGGPDGVPVCQGDC